MYDLIYLLFLTFERFLGGIKNNISGSFVCPVARMLSFIFKNDLKKIVLKNTTRMYDFIYLLFLTFERFLGGIRALMSASDLDIAGGNNVIVTS